MEQLSGTCQTVSVQRTYLTTTIDRVKRGYSGIVPKINKINNIKKVVEIMEVWGKAKLPYLLSVDIAHPYRYDLEDVLGLIESAK